MLRKLGIALIFAVSLSACGYVDEYERQVHDWEPTYCYKSLGAVQCYREPKYSDRLRLVNYYGPHPSRYDAPEPMKEPNFKAPEMVNYWVKDPEPVPRPMAKGDLADRPWLTADGQLVTARSDGSPGLEEASLHCARGCACGVARTAACGSAWHAAAACRR